MHLPLDRYLNYAEMTELIQEWAGKHPDRLKLESLGKSHQGREIWCLTVTRFKTGEDKPALWIDGNIHATEFCATHACLHFVDHMLRNDGRDPVITELMDTRIFYVVPRVCPDGAELAFAPKPRYIRSSARPYPLDEEPLEGWETEDIDGDGRILSIRIQDPTGAWKISKEDPRILTRRDPADREGPFYRILPEGKLVQDEWDGITIGMAPTKEGLDLNRNFPWKWRRESEQSGAGPYPASEPEVRACVEFLVKRDNLCHALTLHTFSGVLLRPSSTEPDENMPVEDLETYKFFGQKGSEFTGYPALTVYHDFRYHPKENITGTFDDWAYEHLGVYAWTIEIWSAFRAAGLTDGFMPDTPRGKHRFLKWFHEHPLEEELQLLRWSDEKLDGKGCQAWRPFQHPQLGAVEIGGWDMFTVFRNPPPAYLEAELTNLTRWMVWMAQTTPVLALHSHKSEPLGGDAYRLQMVVENRGWLPSYVSKKALERKNCRPLRFELELPPEVRLKTGKLKEEAGQLEGIAYKRCSPLWTRSDPTDHRVKMDWVVTGPRDAEVSLRAVHDRAGTVEVKTKLWN